MIVYGDILQYQLRLLYRGHVIVNLGLVVCQVFGGIQSSSNGEPHERTELYTPTAARVTLLYSTALYIYSKRTTSINQ